MAEESSYSAHWTEPGRECGVSASEYGVNFWWSTGPRESDGWGESYTWERWFAEGRIMRRALSAMAAATVFAAAPAPFRRPMPPRT